MKTQARESERLPQDEFESLLNEIESPIEEIAERELLTSETDEGGTVCFGDSGGPLYARSGSEVFLLGVASRSKSEENMGICEFGAVYTLAPAHADWIYEKAPEAIADGGGRCSASPVSDQSSPVIPLAALAVLLLVCVRRRRKAITPFVVLTISLFGCSGSHGSNVTGSLCTQVYDPLGLYCDEGTARIDLQSAERIAREIVPEDAWFWSAAVADQGAINPDGEAEAWLIEYYLPEQSVPPDSELRSITVQANGERTSATEPSQLKCTPTRPITPLSSKALVHEAIGRLQSEGLIVRLGEGATLYLVQAHRCSTQTDGWNAVTYDDALVWFNESGKQLGFYQYPPEPEPPTLD